jgi:hypothetical protein
VGEARAQQPLRDGLEHDAHADVDLPERGEVSLAHDTRIRVRQESRFPDDEGRDLSQIAERRAMPHAPEEVAVLGEDRLRPVTQGKQRFFGAEPLAGSGQRQDLVGSHAQRAGLAGVAAKGAVPAVVATEVGQRDEDLGGEGHAPAAAAVSHRRRRGQQVGQQRRGSRQEGPSLLR